MDKKFANSLDNLYLILTYDEEETINDKHGTIEVVPVWKWLMGDSSRLFAADIAIARQT